jgi:alpha-L-fucosidase
MNRRTFVELALLGAPATLMGAQAAKRMALPTREQREWQDLELETFIHFGPKTWPRSGSGKLYTPVEEITPEKLDVEQWADVAESMGSRQIVFTAKHGAGFCWWQTETSPYGVKEISWRHGKGDVMRDLAACCHRRGIKLGVYLSPRDLVFGVETGGRSVDPAGQENYNRIYRQQLTEILSRYGNIGEIWFDGNLIIDVGDILQRYAPKAMVFQSQYCTIRWVGNEIGFAPDPNWNAVSAEAARSGVATAKDGDPEGDRWLPVEVDARIRSEWFWSPTNEATLKSLDELMAMYYRSVGHGACLLLDQGPDRSGLIPAGDARRTAEFGAEIRRRFTKSLAETRGRGSTVELQLGRTAAIDHVITMEDLAQGQRVREYRIEGLIAGEWHELAVGKSVGQKKIDAFKPVDVSAVRWHCTKSAAAPILRKLAVYHVGAQGPGQAGPPPIYHTLYEWNEQSLPADANVTWDLNIGPYCAEAGQYEVTLVVTGGGGILLRSATLFMGGVETPEFVKRPAGTDRVVLVSLPGVNPSVKLRMVVSRRRDPSFGQVMLRRID